MLYVAYTIVAQVVSAWRVLHRVHDHVEKERVRSPLSSHTVGHQALW